MDINANTGDWNTGNWNTGNSNTGYWNTGDRNTGDWNTGNRNTGDWNTGNWNTGYLNTTEPRVRIFNKDTDVERGDIKFPSFFNIDVTEWINEIDMTKEEKESNPTYKNTGGYLKNIPHREAWRIAWDKADYEDKRKVLDLPNWDNEVFEEISGINVEKELKKRETIRIGGVEYDKNEVEERLKDIKAV